MASTLPRQEVMLEKQHFSRGELAKLQSNAWQPHLVLIQLSTLIVVSLLLSIMDVPLSTFLAALGTLMTCITCTLLLLSVSLTSPLQPAPYWSTLGLLRTTSSSLLVIQPFVPGALINSMAEALCIPGQTNL